MPIWEVDYFYCTSGREPWNALLEHTGCDFVRVLPNAAAVIAPRDGGVPRVIRGYGRPGWLESQWSAEFLQDGAEALLALEHAHVVRFFDIGCGHPSVSVHEYVDGLTMEQLSGALPLSAELAVYITVASCDALTTMHAGYGLHTKVAPHHVLVSKTGHVKLTGHEERNIQRSTQTSASNIPRPRPLAFISPEGITGQPITGLSDQYCLGECLATWLLGANPFLGAEPPTHIIRQLEARYRIIQGKQPIPALSSHSSEVPNELLQVLHRAMHHDPIRRFAHPGALRAALLGAYPISMPRARQALAALVTEAQAEPSRPLPQGAGVFCW